MLVEARMPPVRDQVAQEMRAIDARTA
jgi:hypothetical protein